MKVVLSKRRLPLLSLVLLSVFSLGAIGCGYHVAGRSSALPPEIHVIAIPALENMV